MMCWEEYTIKHVHPNFKNNILKWQKLFSYGIFGFVLLDG